MHVRVKERSRDESVQISVPDREAGNGSQEMECVAIVECVQAPLDGEHGAHEPEHREAEERGAGQEAGEIGVITRSPEVGHG
jgi:hypothetical protein